ncbi:MAG: thylakoid membrane photosystem I accumulation factor [Elainellaceae cyanobacterium]
MGVHLSRDRIIRLLKRFMTGAAIAIALIVFLLPAPALAGLDDDRYDGSIFPLYAGNGSLIPPRVTLAKSLDRPDRPTVLGFYVDDSQDCKRYAATLTQIDAFYGRAADLIFISVDAIPPQETYTSTEAGHYYRGFVPQTVIFNQGGDVVFDELGSVPFEQIDDTLRQVFDLLPRSESVELRRRVVNELNTELVPEIDAKR